MGFVNSLFLLGAVCASIPLIIHLIERLRIRRVVFGSIMFLRTASRQVMRRRKMAELILLLLRMALLLLVAFAFARPFVWPEASETPAAGADAAADRALLVMIDRSASMSVGKRMEAAKEKATQAIQAERGAAKIAVAGFAGGLEVQSAFDGGERGALRAVQSMKAGFEGTDLAAALRQAEKLLEGVRAPHKEILVVSDFHRTAWERFKGDRRLDADVRLRLEDVAPKEIANSAVLQVVWPLSVVAGPTPRTFVGKVGHFGAEPVEDAKLVVRVGETVVEEQKVFLNPFAVLPIMSKRVFDAPGFVTGGVSLGGGDAMPLDDTYHFAVHVVPKVRVLLVNGRTGAAPETNDGFFIAKALAPSESAPCQVTEVAPEQVNAENLSRADIVVLADVPALAGPVAAALKEFVQGGGGAVFFPGGLTNPDAFNAAFGEVAPCKLRELVDLKRDNPLAEGARIEEIDLNHDIFRAFAAPHHGDFRSLRFSKYYQVKDSQLATVVARFEDGSPALLEKRIGTGYAILMPTAVNPAWNDMVYRALFPPLLHEIVGYVKASAGSGVGSVLVGQRAAVDLPKGTVKAVVTDPSGGESTLEIRAGRAEAEFYPGVPGVYWVSAGDSRFPVAVNLDPGEMDPRKQNTEEIMAALTGKATGTEDLEDQGVPKADAEQAVKERIDARQQVWWYLLVAVLLLMGGEIALAKYCQAPSERKPEAAPPAAE